jgi:hypothetical protein
MKTKVTLRIEAGLVERLHRLARHRGQTLSELAEEQLQRTVCEGRSFERARRRAMLQLRRGFDLQWTPAGCRAELHNRATNHSQA